MRSPYVYTSPRVCARQAIGFDNERGVTWREVEGEHAIWAARVPFLPAMLSADFTRLGRERIPLIQLRQFRFLYDLARAREHHATFELRFIARPNPIPGQPNPIEIVFLGKVFSIRPRGGHELAERLWEKFVANFPLEDPFNYPLEPVTRPEDFHRCYEPIPLDQIEPANVLEIRKYEDMPIRSAAPLHRVERIGDYIAHPFVPNTHFGPMARFFAALADQPTTCYAGVSLRPTRMFDQEIYNVSFAIGQFHQTHSEGDSATEEYIRTRAKIGEIVYQRLMLEREQPVLVRVHLVSESGTPFGLAEALGSEMMGNLQNDYPTQWALAQPADENEMALARNNLRYLEHDHWGHTIAAPPLQRLRYLATADEACGAFRLPVPPESGYMPGVLVKNEPFVAPPDLPEAQPGTAARQPIDLGIVYHRGYPTAQTFTVDVSQLPRHTLIAGSTGSGKSTTIKHLLAQLWTRHQIPFLVLYPIDKPDYRELRGIPGLKDDLLAFTLGDEGCSPFRLNPFEVPDGVLLKAHLSRLMRVFTAAFTLQDPLPMIYREALRRVYRDHGWDVVLDRGRSDRVYPTMADFYAAIRAITDDLKYGREVQDTVRQASVIRIGDLLENAGHIVNVRRSMSLATILDRPTVMELGRIGSPQDTTLLMGFLLMRFAEEVERHPRPADRPHLTVVEEAHRLMAETSPNPNGGDSRASAGEDFANILAEVRGFGEGIVVAEQIPTLLVKGAIGNTYLKIAHWLEDPASFDLFGKVLNLSDEQREYARTLTAGFAIVRGRDGRPVHVKVPAFDEHPGFDRAASADLSDETIREHMRTRRASLGLDDVPVDPWDASLAATPKAPELPSDILGLLLGAPMKTCAFCHPLHATRRCPHGRVVRERVLVGEYLQQRQAELDYLLDEADEAERWARVRALGETVEAGVRGLEREKRPEVAYCVLAHLIDPVLADRGDERAERRSRARTILRQFDRRYVEK